MFNFSPSAFLCFLLYPKTKVSLQKKKTLNNTRKAYKNSLYTLMKRLIVFLILFLQSFYLFPARTVKVTPILTLPQLPVSAIHRIFQDSQGYMWYGTVNGLCQDDGYRLRVFRSDINAEKIMENNIIQSIAEDAKGRIWFGCDQGAYILNKQDGQITPLDPKRLGTLFISHIRRTSDGMMWITAGNALIRYNSEGLFQQSYPLYDYNQKSSWMTGFCESRQKEIFITVKRGDILRYDKKKDNFFLYAKAPARKNLTYIIQDRAHDYFWIGTESDGVVLFNPSATRDSLFTYSPLPVNSMGEKEGNVLYLAQDDTEGWLWMTTRSDLIAMKYNEKTKQLQQADFQLPPSGRMLNEIFKDKNGALWVASFDRESFMIHFVEDAPKEYNLPALKLHTNFQPAIMALCDAGEHIFWISQERTGLGLYDLDRDRMSLFSDFSHLASLALHSVKQISSSRREGNVWVIPENQNFAYELSRKGMQIYLKRTVKLNDAKYNTPFTQTYEDTQGTLWIGTYRGLHAYHIKDGDCKTVCDTLGTVSAIKEDKNGIIYVSTLNKGVYRVTRDGKYTHLTSPSSVTCLAIDDNETLWMGTQEGGVYAFTPFSGKLTNHTQLCGLNGGINRKNEELYADSEELIKMRNYLTASSFCNNENNAPDSEYSTLNKLLLQKATQTIEQNLEEPDFDVNRLAAGVGVSRSTLTRKLKALTGRTPLEFIHHIKMQHARRLLEGPNQTVSEVALTLGYFNRKHFTACFKEEFGMTPSEYHKKSIAEGKDLNQKGDDNG